jgi:hypothetical protein
MLPARLKTSGLLWLLLVASVAVCLIWGAIAATTAIRWTSAANPIVSSAGPLSFDAQQAYRVLSDADSAEGNAYLAGIESAVAITQVRGDVNTAEADLMAVRAGDRAPAVQADLTTLSAGLPAYTNLIGKADALNTEGQPLGAAYLSEASNYLRVTLLPAANDLSQKEDAGLNADYGQATGPPYAIIGAALLIAVAAIFAQIWLAGRTRRTFNTGLLAASLIGLLSLGWLLIGYSSARADLLAARDKGSGPSQAIAQAEVTALGVHSDESLTLINRDDTSGTLEALRTQEKALSKSEGTLTAQLVGAANTGSRAGGNGSPGAVKAAAAARDAQAWYHVLTSVYEFNQSGNYLGRTGAVALAIGGSTQAFEKVDTALKSGIGADQATFVRQAQAGDNALGGLVVGLLGASLLMAAACAWGVSRRMAEYR